VNSKGEKELVHRLIGLYLLRNTETALEEICGISKKEQYQIKQDVIAWAKNTLPSKPQNYTQVFLPMAGIYDPTDFSVLQEDFIDPVYQEQRKAIEVCGVYLWGKNSIDPAEAERVIQNMEEKCPHCKTFFGLWARTRVAVLSCTFDSSEMDTEFQKKALEGYRKVFDEGRNYAGKHLKPFIEESIAVSVYFDRRRIQDIPKVIDTDKSLKAPITK
jgi:hypothetical protein